MFLISGLGCFRISRVAAHCQLSFSIVHNCFKHTFVAVTVWHLAIHEDKMEWAAIVASSLKCIDRLEAIQISVAFETQLLYEADGNSLEQVSTFHSDHRNTGAIMKPGRRSSYLVNQIIFRDTDSELVPRYCGKVDACPCLWLVTIVFSGAEFCHRIRLATVTLILRL